MTLLFPIPSPRSTARVRALRRWRSRIKRSTVVRSALYRQYRDDKPRLDPSVAAELRTAFADEGARLDTLLGRPVSDMWGYDPGQVS